jgi:hypothetical protein
MEASGEPQKAAAGGSTAATGGKVSASTYETAEERKIKQMYIIKQSSIANAIDFHKAQNGVEFGILNVLDTAQQFVDYIYGNNETLSQGLDSMDNDI